MQEFHNSFAISRHMQNPTPFHWYLIQFLQYTPRSKILQRDPTRFPTIKSPSNSYSIICIYTLSQVQMSISACYNNIFTHTTHQPYMQFSPINLQNMVWIMNQTQQLVQCGSMINRLFGYHCRIGSVCKLLLNFPPILREQVIYSRFLQFSYYWESNLASNTQTYTPYTRYICTPIDFGGICLRVREIRAAYNTHSWFPFMNICKSNGKLGVWDETFCAIDWIKDLLEREKRMYPIVFWDVSVIVACV